MADPETTLRDSPVDFESAVAYALHPEMRRLIILYIVGSVLISLGLSVAATRSLFGVIGLDVLIGVSVAVLGAVCFFGGLVGALFKLVTDANLLAAAESE